MRGVLLGLVCLWISGCTGAGMALEDVAPADAASEASSDAAPTDTVTCAHPCNGVCVDTTFDGNNCGSCGHACTASQYCNAGVCAAHDTGMVPYYGDADGDGFGVLNGTPAGMVAMGSPAPHGYSLTHDDCNDNVATTFPHAPEPCDGVDENCDGYADNEPLQTMYESASPLYSAGTCANVARAHSLGGWMSDVYPNGPWCMRPGVAVAGYQTVPQYLCEACPSADAGTSTICQCWDGAGNVMVCPR